VTEYSASILEDKPFTIERTLLGGYPQYSNDKHSVVFKGTYLREGVKHVVILGYIFHNDVGIEIIGDATLSVFNLVENDINQFVKSVYLKD
jgi:hypothetical protein